jgi:ATP-dependent Clp endopeptidase proteolytic subunit ClpP
MPKHNLYLPREAMMENKWFNIKNETNENIVEFYNEIGAWGTTAEMFSEQFNKLDQAKALTVRINSPGGSVFDGVTIYNLLNEYKGSVRVVVDGIAASIASVIAMAGDSVEMHDTAMMMVHKPWMMTMGNADQIRKDAALLDTIQTQIRKAYQAKSGMSDADLDDIINEETWLTPEDAKEYGLIDTIIVQKKKDQKKNSLEKRLAALDNHNIMHAFSALPGRIAACLRPVKNDIQSIPPVATTKTDNTPIPVVEPAKIENNQPAENGQTVDNINQKEPLMTPEEIKAAEKAAADKAKMEERNRVSEIKASAKALNISDELVEKAINDGIAADEARKDFIAKFAANAKPAPAVSTTVVVDESDKFRMQNKASIQAAAGLLKGDEKRVALSNGGATSIHSLFRTVLARNGVKGTDMLDGERLVSAAHKIIKAEMVGTGTGDLTSILADSTNKALDIGLATARVSYPAWTKSRAVKDFKTFNLTKMSGVSDVQTILEGEKFQIGAVTDKKESGTLKTKGIVITLSRQAQINDDLGALSDMGMALGNAIMNAKERDCYDTLYGSAGVGPTLTETARALFNTTEGNYQSSGAAPSSTTVDAGQLAMMTRPRLKGNPADKTVPTGALPRFLIVPPKHKGAAERLVYSSTFPDATYPQGVYNQYNRAGSNPMDVVVSAYLGSVDADGWYLATDPNEIATLVMLTLNGNESPFVESAESTGDDPLGITFRCYHDWAWMVGDWRGLYLNDGD